MPYSPFGLLPIRLRNKLELPSRLVGAGRGTWEPTCLFWPPNGSARPPGSPHSRSALRPRQPCEREAGSAEPASADPSRGRLRENCSGENYCRPGVTTRCSPTARSDDPGLGAAPRACHHRAGLRPLQRRRWPTCRQGRSRHLACAAITGHLLRAAAALASLVCAKARTATIRRDPVNVAARNGHGHLALHLPDAGTDRPAPMNVLEPPSVHPAT